MRQCWPVAPAVTRGGIRLPGRRVGGRHPLAGMIVVPDRASSAGGRSSCPGYPVIPGGSAAPGPAVLPVPPRRVRRAARRPAGTRSAPNRQPRHRPSRRPG